MYVLYAEWNFPDEYKCFVYDLTKEEETDLPISLDNFTSPGFIQVDPVTEDIYIGDSPFGALSTVYVYTKDGRLKTSFETGMYTTNIRFVTE